MSSIPIEVIFEILCDLPVKSLLRFRCVCKSWKSRIDSPSFIKTHLDQSREIRSFNNNARLVLSEDSSLRVVSFNSPMITADVHSIQVNYPLKYDDSPTVVMGYCNGVLLISCGLDFALWNPSTREYLKLPYLGMKQPLMGSICCQFHLGFGFDQTTDDYKVLRIMKSSNGEQKYSEALVYSLKSGSWRRVKDFPLWVFQDIGGIFALAALHWVACKPSEVDNEYMIVTFDLGSEEYGLVPLPLLPQVPYLVDLGVLDGCLSMSCSYIADRVDIWLMKDRADKDSWTKLLSLTQASTIRSLKKNVIPITYSRGGKCVVLEKDREQILVYHLETLKVVETVWLHGLSTFSTIPYLGSLIQLKCSGADEASKSKKQGEVNEKKSKKRDDFLSKGFKLKL